MEPVLLYGIPAGSSMGLVAAFERWGRPYRLCRVDMSTEMKTAAFARVNGRQETPVLITEDGRAISETMAIAAWLEARDPDHRISFGRTTAQADRMHQLMAFVNTGFTSAFSPLWTALETEDPDPNLIAQLRIYGLASVAERHRKLEEMVGDDPFLVGERLSLADTTLIGVARWAEFHQAPDIAQFPRLAALRRRIEAEPEVRFAQAIEDGDMPVGSGGCRGHVPLAEILERFAGEDGPAATRSGLQIVSGTQAAR